MGISQAAGALSVMAGAGKESWYAAKAAVLYAAGVSDTLTHALSAPSNPQLGAQYAGRGFPVLLLHGLAHNQSWSVSVARDLQEAGFVTRSVNYATLNRTLDAAGDDIAAHILRLVDASDVDHVHVVAHSLGGLALRAALANHPELADVVVTAVTVGTPHRGTPWARECFTWLPFLGPVVREMIPGSAALMRLDEAAQTQPTRWVCIWSPDDEIVPGMCGLMVQSGATVTSVRLRGVGHAGLMYDRQAVAAVVTALVDSDAVALAQYVDKWAAARQPNKHNVP